MTLGQCLLVAQRADGGFIAVPRSRAVELRGHRIVAAWLHGDPASEDGQYLVNAALPALKNNKDETIPDPKRI